MKQRSIFDGLRFRFGPFVHQTYGIPAGTSDIGALLAYACAFVNEDRTERVRKALPHVRSRAPFHTLAQGRDQWSELLNAAIDKRTDLAGPSAEDWIAARDQLQATAGWGLIIERSEDGPVQLLNEARISTDEGMRAVLRVILMHEAYRELLRRCPNCGRLFMKAGKRLYCSDACATSANEAGLALRQKQRRLRLAALALLPKRASEAERMDAVKAVLKSHPEVVTPEQLAARVATRLKRSTKTRLK